MPAGRKRSLSPADNPLSQFVRQWLEEHGLSREKAAKRWGISQGTLRNIEAGMDLNTGRPYKPKVAMLRQLAAGMGVPLATLLKLQGEEDNVRTPAVPPDPLLAAMDRLLEVRLLEIFTNHVALSRDLLADLAGSFAKLERLLAQFLKESRKHGLSPSDRRSLRRQIDALEQHRTSYVVPVQGLVRSLCTLLEGQKLHAEAEADRLSSELREIAPPAAEGPKIVAFPVQKAGEEPKKIVPFPPSQEGRAAKPAVKRGDEPKLQDFDSLAFNGSVAAGRTEMSMEGLGDWIPVAIAEVRKAEAVVLVRGDSMIDADIHDGDYVFYRQADDISQKDIVVAYTPTHGMIVKRFDFDDEGRPVLLSENPDQDTNPPIPFEDGTCIHGKMVAVKGPEEVERWRKQYEQAKQAAEE